MAHRVAWSSRAIEDLEAIAQYISADSSANRSARVHSNSPCLDQDDTFAYIAGYTESGFAMASPGKSGNKSSKRVQALPSWKLAENPLGRKAL
jgi:hypothetical protein